MKCDWCKNKFWFWQSKWRVKIRGVVGVTVHKGCIYDFTRSNRSINDFLKGPEPIVKLIKWGNN